MEPGLIHSNFNVCGDLTPSESVLSILRRRFNFTAGCGLEDMPMIIDMHLPELKKKLLQPRNCQRERRTAVLGSLDRCNDSNNARFERKRENVAQMLGYYDALPS